MFVLLGSKGGLIRIAYPHSLGGTLKTDRVTLAYGEDEALRRQSGNGDLGLLAVADHGNGIGVTHLSLASLHVYRCGESKVGLASGFFHETVDLAGCRLAIGEYKRGAVECAVTVRGVLLHGDQHLLGGGCISRQRKCKGE